MAIWANEVQHFTYGGPNDPKKMGHYTQVIYLYTSQLLPVLDPKNVHDYDQDISNSNALHRKEESQNSNCHDIGKTTRLFHPHKVDSKTRKDTNYYITKEGPCTERQQTMGTAIKDES